MAITKKIMTITVGAGLLPLPQAIRDGLETQYIHAQVSDFDSPREAMENYKDPVDLIIYEIREGTPEELDPIQTLKSHFGTRVVGLVMEVGLIPPAMSAGADGCLLTPDWRIGDLAVML